MDNKDKMLKDIGIVDFVLVELTLYLDMHPYDCKAMEYFNHYNRMKIQMEKEFAVKFFPLNTRLAESNKTWNWGVAPLPWEGACV